MKVLVTGGTGFIGTHLVRELIKEGHETAVLVKSKEKGEGLKQRLPVTVIYGDVTKMEEMDRLDEEAYDVVFHLAAVGHVSAASEESYEWFRKINEAGTENLISAFKKSQRLKKFIHFSSTAAMGFLEKSVLNELSVPNPLTPYQKSKFRSEQLPIKAWKESGFPAFVLRPCMVYGPGGYGEFYKFCRLMKKGLFPRVGRKRNLTPLVYVGDVVTASIRSMDAGKPGETYIIASKTSIEMDDLHGLIMKEIGSKSPYLYIPSRLALLGAGGLEAIAGALKKEPVVTRQNIRSTITDRTFDIQKIQKELGFAPQMSFEEGIHNTILWYKEQGRI